MISIIDYGAGNLKSVQNALAYLECPSRIIDDPRELMASQAAILPGVGAFGDAMNSMNRTGFADAVREYAASGRPLLGICLGMQLLFDASEESPGVQGLSVLPGTLRRIPNTDGQKVPHMGWNSLQMIQTGGVFRGIAQGSYVYFVHSYYLSCSGDDFIAAATQYGVPIGAAVQKGNVAATQFHPEKSGEVGLTMLRNFIDIANKKGEC